MRKIFGNLLDNTISTSILRLRSTETLCHLSLCHFYTLYNQNWFEKEEEEAENSLDRNNTNMIEFNLKKWFPLRLWLRRGDNLSSIVYTKRLATLKRAKEKEQN